MIESIVPLPEFANAGTVIHGIYTGGGIYGTEDEIPDCPELHLGGRDIEIQPSILFKYKMIVTVPLKERQYHIVFVSTTKLNILNLRDTEEAVIFPLYVREYPTNGKKPVLRSNAILSMKGINRLFEFMNVGEVASMAEAIYHLMNRVHIDDFSRFPKYAAEHMYATGLGTLAPTPPNLGVLMAAPDGACAEELDTITDYGCILSGYLPTEIVTILTSECMRQILPFVDPHHTRSLTTTSVLSAMKDWGSLCSWIHKWDEQTPRYETTSIGESVKDILFYGASFHTIDFDIECDPSLMHGRQQMFDPYNCMSINPQESPGYIIQFGNAIFNHLGFNQFEGYCRVVGSYLEDLWIYDRQGELLCYIDLVWWILAQGGGLLNSNAVFI